jgi:pimeloyl-ACP methyl ester carboxylesterase
MLLGAAGLFVLAPAFFMDGYEDLTPAPPSMPICILHGWHDAIVPVENSIRYARSCSATLHIVNGDHRLTDNIAAINEYLTGFIRAITSA